MNYVFDNGTHIKTKVKDNVMMRNLLIALIPVIIFAIYNRGINALILILVGIVTSLVSESLYAIIVNKKRGSELKSYLKNAYIIFPGLFLALILPSTTPVLHLVLGSMFATIVGKMFFGGFGHNIFNPALLGYLFIMICYGIGVDAISGSTPLTNLTMVGFVGSEASIIKTSLFDMFLGVNKGGAIGEVSGLIILISFIYLTVTKTIKVRIPLYYLGTVFVMTAIIGLFNDMGIWYPLFHLLSGGLLFGAVFMATDPVTTPVTPIGQIMFGTFLGLLTVVIRFVFPYPEGVMISILTMNMFVPLLDKLGVHLSFSFVKQMIVSFLVMFIALAASLGIALSYQKDEVTVDPKFNIDNVYEKNGFTIYEVTAKLRSNAKIRVEIDDEGTVTNITILEHNETESYYNQVINDNNYLDKLISLQKNLDKLDAVSGATVTSTGLKNMLEKVIKDYHSR